MLKYNVIFCAVSDIVIANIRNDTFLTDTKQTQDCTSRFERVAMDRV